jgi:integrase/recombinase XerD
LSNEDYLKEYIAYLEYKNKAPKTIKGYNIDLNLWFKYIIKYQNNKSILELNRKDVEKFFRYNLVQLKNSAWRIHRLRTSIVNFIKYLVREEYLGRNYAEGVEVPQIDKKKKPSLSFDEVEKLRELLKDNIKERCLFEVMLATGARVNEIHQIKIKSIDFEKMMITDIIAKRRKPVTLLLQPEAIKWINKYLETRSDNSEYLFISRENNDLSVRRIQMICNKWGEMLGLEWILTPHRLRATCATLCFLKGLPAEYVQQILNHENVNTTLENYINLVKDKVQTERLKYQI